MKNRNMRMRYLASCFGRGNRVFALDIAAARSKAQGLKQRIDKARDELAEMAMKDDYKAADGKKLSDQIAGDVAQYNALMGAVRADEEAAAARVAASFNGRMQQGRDLDAMGGLYRDLMTSGAPSAATINALSLPTTVTSGTASGGVLLPKTVSHELIGDIVTGDGVLEHFTLTEVTGLSLPKVSIAASASSANVADGTAAPEATIAAGMINFRRIPYAQCVTVPTSLLEDTNTAIADFINRRHYKMMRAHILGKVFAASPSGDYEPMSVYGATTANLTAVAATANTAAAKLDAIFTALSQLDEESRANAKVVLKAADYFAMIKSLANGAQALFGGVDSRVLGFEAVLCEYAATPIVGDLSVIHLNYDSGVRLASDSHAKEGTTDIVLRTAFDVQITQPGALRKITVAASGGA